MDTYWWKKSTFMLVVLFKYCLIPTCSVQVNRLRSKNLWGKKGPSALAVSLGYYQSSKKIHLFISNSANKAGVCCLDRFLLSCVAIPLKRRDAGAHRIALKTRTEQLVHFAVRTGATSTAITLRAQPCLSQPISYRCRVTMAFSDSSVCCLKQAQWKKRHWCLYKVLL